MSYGGNNYASYMTAKKCIKLLQVGTFNIVSLWLYFS